MATIVNNPGNGNSGNSMGLILGVILILVFVFLFIVYVVPLVRQSMGPTQVNVPDKIDVNVQQGGGN
jgi:hypothetical protein